MQLFGWYYQYKKIWSKLSQNRWKGVQRLDYYIGYMAVKVLKHLKINSVNPLYLIINKCNGYFEEINTNKCLKLVPTNESKEIV